MTTKHALFQKYPLDFWVCAVLFLASVLLFVDAQNYPDKAVLFPIIMLVCIMGLSAYCMAASVIKRRKALREAAGATGTAAPGKTVDRKAVAIFGLMIAVYAFCTPYAGFGLASLIFIGAGTVFFGERKTIAVVAIPVATMLFVYTFFIYFLDVSIPFFPAFSL
jgi:hypothetical protein